MYGYIYKRVNLLNGKVYVGQHKYVKENIELDINYRGSGKIFKQALAKYGEDAFTYELIDYAETPEELNEKEKYWIKQLDCLNPKGYNICEGGAILLPEELRHEIAVKANKSRGQGWHQPTSQKQKMSEFMKNKEITPEFRESCRKAKLGNSYGKANRDTFWITDGVHNYRLHKGESYDETVYRKGRTYSQETKKAFKDNYSNKLCIHKGNEIRYIEKEDLETYLNQGFELGTSKELYKDRGASISKSKKGCIHVISPDGKLKYIKPEQLNDYIKLGYRKRVN